MERLFDTHVIRKSRPCASLWTLTTPDAGGLSAPEKVMVPGVWESHPALRNYRGRGVYEQTIRAGGNVRLCFGGVSFRAKVYLDGLLLGEHYGAYTAFDVLAEGLPEGEHALRVEADNRFDADSALHIPNDYYAYGGINRPVTVEEVGEAYLEWCRVTPRYTKDGWMADADVSVRSLADQPLSAEVRLSLAGAEESRQILIPGRGAARVSVAIACKDAAAWSPAHPALYPVQAVLNVDGAAVDDLIDRIGFREIRVEGNRILLNGQRLCLRGFNRHEEYGSFGLSAPVDAMLQDLQLMRDMGANCVRTCHYPNDLRFLDL
ncbi:MAG: hypothetical protein IJ174_03020, partial [Clostridia bacterium]|nr:hypothetical protein [Clostridia bacterium]